MCRLKLTVSFRLKIPAKGIARLFRKPLTKLWGKVPSYLGSWFQDYVGLTFFAEADNDSRKPKDQPTTGLLRFGWSQPGTFLDYQSSLGLARHLQTLMLGNDLTRQDIIELKSLVQSLWACADDDKRIPSVVMPPWGDIPKDTNHQYH